MPSVSPAAISISVSPALTEPSALPMEESEILDNLAKSSSSSGVLTWRRLPSHWSAGTQSTPGAASFNRAKSAAGR